MKTDRGAEYTHIGKEDDATSIANLKQALAYLEQCNQIRKGENLSDLRVATDMTAEAEACANWSSVDAQHHGTFENLAWGTDPYRLWYTEEKQNVAKGSGETGHYKNLVNSEVLVTGYGYNSGSTCSAQEFALGPLDDTYTVSEYEAKLDEYLAFVETAAASHPAARAPGPTFSPTHCSAREQHVQGSQPSRRRCRTEQGQSLLVSVSRSASLMWESQRNTQ